MNVFTRLAYFTLGFIAAVLLLVPSFDTLLTSMALRMVDSADKFYMTGCLYERPKYITICKLQRDQIISQYSKLWELKDGN